MSAAAGSRIYIDVCIYICIYIHTYVYVSAFASGGAPRPKILRSSPAVLKYAYLQQGTHRVLSRTLSVFQVLYGYFLATLWVLQGYSMGVL
jgi:hypothetical protein